MKIILIDTIDICSYESRSKPPSCEVQYPMHTSRYVKSLHLRRCFSVPARHRRSGYDSYARDGFKFFMAVITPWRDNVGAEGRCRV